MAARLPVVAVSGWGMPSSLLDACLPQGRDLFRITPEQLLEAIEDEPETAIARRMPELPERAIWIGWSLGGQLAMQASKRTPQHVAGVMTLCANPCFVGSKTWSAAVTPQVFDDFQRRLKRSSTETLSHFCSLMIHGADRAGEDRRWLRRAEWLELPEDWRLERTLGWLGELDQRPLWKTPSVPSWHLFGEKDALVPASAGAELGIPESRWQVMPAMGHWPGGYFASRVRECLEQWCDRVSE
ncbi:pimeloyl-[acyl-carrier protein] methyl ester esterase [Halospina denitrificans]|uniref:Pimeloyl-[acyl-carrier protein] methyl ester esterase n=1 Tax=Halospina denitrificans TaxID=332522 RepID=A0A4R7JXR8_9GAMM|nr:alpha/beta fold hydrolase [Halospina denitrificans]TDT43280.1 pimeloyl-[acyl-carrier protein] methyl ester esterase [Halospina denitrificans]